MISSALKHFFPPSTYIERSILIGQAKEKLHLLQKKKKKKLIFVMIDYWRTFNNLQVLRTYISDLSIINLLSLMTNINHSNIYIYTVYKRWSNRLSNYYTIYCCKFKLLPYEWII